MKPIRSFRGKAAFLSNFHPCNVRFGGHEYPTVEHAYQAAKTTDEEWRARIAAAETPGEAKKLGRKAPPRQDWLTAKVDVMRQLVAQKFSWLLNHDLARALWETGDAEIAEGNKWHDNEWGDCSCAKCKGKPGKNLLGNMLMEIRAHLRETYDHACETCGTLLPVGAWCWDHERT